MGELGRCFLRSREAAAQATSRAHPCGGQFRVLRAESSRKLLRPPGLNFVLFCFASRPAGSLT
eukprot:6113517-Pleurochrysis_carterae.AAC.1